MALRGRVEGFEGGTVMNGYNNIPDHPEIACALRTGYPRPLQPHITCADCDKELYGDDLVYAPDGVIVCEDCMETRIQEMDTSALAAALGIACTTAGNRLEEIHER